LQRQIGAEGEVVLSIEYLDMKSCRRILMSEYFILYT
jgi:hypothetical protein